MKRSKFHSCSVHPMLSCRISRSCNALLLLGSRIFLRILKCSCSALWVLTRGSENRTLRSEGFHKIRIPRHLVLFFRTSGRACTATSDSYSILAKKAGLQRFSLGSLELEYLVIISLLTMNVATFSTVRFMPMSVRMPLRRNTTVRSVGQRSGICCPLARLSASRHQMVLSV